MKYWKNYRMLREKSSWILGIKYSKDGFGLQLLPTWNISSKSLYIDN